MADNAEIHRRIVQGLRTDRLFGVDQVPRSDVDAVELALRSSVCEALRVSRSSRPQSPSSQSPIESAAAPQQRARAHERAAPEIAPRAVHAPVITVARGAVPTDAQKPAPAAVLSAEARARWELLEELRCRHDRQCAHCTTATAHTQTVFGQGNPVAELMFVGEAPGETEDRLGQPFVGRAGQKLDEIIAAMGLRRTDVYIANVLKSRPPDNRTPLRHEVEACGPYLHEQIQIIRPRVIVTLGGPAAKLLLGVETGISRLRGVWAEVTLGEFTVPVMPTFHPAYLLRNYTPQTRRQVWSDMLAVCARLGIDPTSDSRS